MEELKQNAVEPEKQQTDSPEILEGNINTERELKSKITASIHNRGIPLNIMVFKYLEKATAHSFDS
ncbi:hypothetical protein F9U64_20705 [Gracilibacillus oryzae]|uniref:Uncharacterized protein n=1 Tax=Gracilibacillus oryzae TaxID=1672701 RepID=A0A7C8KWG3_9BACI|nr:hypothetical protein [Gracilibacillus oryzae]KAB8126056.1 hypothetical protein F9U64_20705 [Gracilibacillus oryzae]